MLGIPSQGMYFLLGVLLLGLLVFLRLVWEPYMLRIRHIRLFDPCQKTIPDDQGLKVAFFTDLHGKGCKIPTEKLLRGLLATEPDIVLFGGDICNSSKDKEVGLLRLKEIAKGAEAKGIPCIAVRGNHDQSIAREEYTQSGFELLENANKRVQPKGKKPFLIMGVNDSGKKDMRWRSPSQKYFKDVPLSHRIVLVHNPEFCVYHHQTFRFLLSGHFHGGQIYLPFHLEYKLFRRESLPNEGIYRGVFTKNQIQGYISHGCGCVLFPFRFLSLPEVCQITILPPESGV